MTSVSNRWEGPQKGVEDQDQKPCFLTPHPVPFLLNGTSSYSQGYPCFRTNQTLSYGSQGLHAENSVLWIHGSFTSYENQGGMSLWLSNDNILHVAWIPLSGRHLLSDLYLFLNSQFAFADTGNKRLHKPQKNSFQNPVEKNPEPLPSWIIRSSQSSSQEFNYLLSLEFTVVHSTSTCRCLTLQCAGWWRCRVSEKNRTKWLTSRGFQYSSVDRHIDVSTCIPCGKGRLA